MSRLLNLEAEVLRDLSSRYAAPEFEADEAPWYPAPGYCGMVHRDGGRSYTVKRGDTWWGLARRILRLNKKSPMSARDYQRLMQNDYRNKGKRMRHGVVIYIPPVKIGGYWRSPNCNEKKK